MKAVLFLSSALAVYALFISSTSYASIEDPVLEVLLSFFMLLELYWIYFKQNIAEMPFSSLRFSSFAFILAHNLGARMIAIVSSLIGVLLVIYVAFIIEKHGLHSLKGNKKTA